MPKTASTALKNHFASEVTTLAYCWKMTRTDGTIKGFTNHDQNIVFDSVTYNASTGFTPTSIQNRADMSVDNLEIEGMLSSASITEADIAAGLYDFAELEVFVVNYEDLTQGSMTLRKGWLGEVTRKKGQFVAEVRGLNQKLTQNIGRLITPNCDAILGDSRCGVTLASFTTSTTVTTVIDRQKFKCSALTQDAGYFTGGEVQFTSGNNSGLKMEIKEFDDTEITLSLPMPYTISASDGVDVIAGCDKTKATCKAKFSNLVNFRGFPDVPGTDKVLKTSGTLDRD